MIVYPSKLRSNPLAAAVDMRGHLFWHDFEVWLLLFSRWADPWLAYQVSITNLYWRIHEPIEGRSHPLITLLFFHLLSPGQSRKNSSPGRESSCRPSERRTERLDMIKGWQLSWRRDLCQNKGFIVMKYPENGGMLCCTLSYPQTRATSNPSPCYTLITGRYIIALLHNHIYLHHCMTANVINKYIIQDISKIKVTHRAGLKFTFKMWGKYTETGMVKVLLYSHKTYWKSNQPLISAVTVKSLHMVDNSGLLVWCFQFKQLVFKWFSAEYVAGIIIMAT